jgi:acyl-coenzyme A synthetase/AMP-(fatty) acid ligase
MRRAVILTPDPHVYLDQLDDYSIMVINPNTTPERIHYLLENSDWSLLITPSGEKHRDGGDYPNERLLYYTSGTTGDSKFYSYSQEQLDAICDRLIDSYNINANDRYTGIMGLWHAAGNSMYWATKRAGCERNFISVGQIRSMSNYSPTYLYATPDMLRIAINQPFDSLRFIRPSAMPLPAGLHDALKTKYNVPIVEYFGQTEAISHILTNPLYGEQRPGTVGLPVSDMEVTIEDGRLFMRGFRTFKPGWIDTGDLADQDERGYYRLLGRSQDQINVKGYKLNPISIERQLLESIDCITQCVVFGESSLKCLYLGDCDPTVIRKFLIDLGVACTPTVLEQVKEIPLTAGGKISRTLLNTLY